MVRGEEQQFEITIDRLLEYTKQVKVSLCILIQKIEFESDRVDWPQVIDSFTSICGQINNLMRFARDHKGLIESRVVLPLHVSPDRDEELSKLTEGRVHMVDHEMVPCYLRTKPDPEIEELEKSIQAKASSVSSDQAVKLDNAAKKLFEHLSALLKANAAKFDNEISRQAVKQSYDTSDTNSLLAAVSLGRGLSMQAMSQPSHRGMQPDASTMMAAKMDPMARQQAMQKQNVKAPELKTNIKTGP